MVTVPGAIPNTSPTPPPREETVATPALFELQNPPAELELFNEITCPTPTTVAPVISSGT
jgi:hypothetical protein